MATINSNNYIPIQYNVLTGGSNGTINNVSPSTSGYILKSNGVSAQPTFQPQSKSLILIQTQTVTTQSTISFTSGITSTYNNYILLITNVSCAAEVYCEIKISIDGGSSYITSGYQSGKNNVSYNSSTITNESITTSFFIAHTASSSVFFNGIAYLNSMTSNSLPSVSFTGCQYNSSTNLAVNTRTYGMYLSPVTVNAFQVFTESSTFSGTFTLYGILE